MRDLRFALRSLRRAPGFTLAALLALTLAIGMATTVFSVADPVLVRPLPYRDADRLVTVGADVRSRGLSDWPVGAEEFEAWRVSSRTLADLAGHQPFGRFTVALAPEPIELAASRITANFLPLLGVSPVIGRHFDDADFVPGAAPAILLTDAVFQRAFQGDPAVVGRSIRVNDAPATIVGVLPRSFVFPARRARAAPDLLVPLVRTIATSSRLTLIGRLAPDVTLEAARVELDGIAASRGGESGIRNARIDGATVTRLAEALSSQPRSLMLLLAGAVAAFLLLGCANVANLLFARGTDRRAELSVRAALGASRASLTRLLLLESALLAAAGGVLGALLAYWSVSILAPLVPADLTLLGPIEINTRALAFATIASAVCVLLAGIGPATGAARSNLMPALSESSARATTSRLRVRRVIVGVQVALAVVLLIGAGLMVTSLVRLLGVDHGFAPDNVLTMRLQLPRGREYPSRSTAFVERSLAAVRTVPGVTLAGAMEGVPLGNTLYGGHYRVEGFSNEWMRQDADTGSGACCTQSHYVSADYFAAAGVPVLRGRSFVAADWSGGEQVAMIGERLARKFPPGIDPLGHYLTAGDDGSDRRRIVGIARDVRDMALQYRPAPTIYLPIEERGSSAITLFVRTGVDPLSLGRAVRDAVQRAAGPVIVTDVRSLDDVILQSTGTRRLNAWLFGSFGVLALGLAAVGVAGVISYTVARRTREFGLRLALGATPSRLRWLIVRESLTPVLAGMAAGLAAALALSRFVASLLYGIEPRDVSTYAAASVLLIATALVAAYLPGRRASRIDPIVALRVE